MSYVRIVAKLVALVLVSAAMYAYLRATAFVLAAIQRLRGSSPSTGTWRGRIFRAWSRCVVRLLGMRTEVDGSPPRPPFIMVSNHLSYVDVVLLGSQVDAVFVAKAEVADWPLVGSLCRSVDTLFIDRATKRDIPRVMRQIEQTLQNGRGVVVFPEGTSSRGDSVRPFRSSLLEAAARAGQSVWYAALSYETPPDSAPAHASVCWWGNAPFGPHLLALLKLPGFRAKLTFGAESICETDRKVLATRLHLAVQQQFQAVV